jgi:bacillopeptidase F (M6 metalloprotease family)
VIILKRIIIGILLSICVTACSNADDSKHEKTENKNLKTDEAVNMIANDEKIIEMLKKKGEIPEDASQEEIAKALQKYLKEKAPGSLKDEKEKIKYINELKEKIQKEKGN